MKNAMKKLMSLVLVAVLLVSAVPFAVSADETCTKDFNCQHTGDQHIAGCPKIPCNPAACDHGGYDHLPECPKACNGQQDCAQYAAGNTGAEYHQAGCLAISKASEPVVDGNECTNSYECKHTGNLHVAGCPMIPCSNDASCDHGGWNHLETCPYACKNSSSCHAWYHLDTCPVADTKEENNGSSNSGSSNNGNVVDEEWMKDIYLYIYTNNDIVAPAKRVLLNNYLVIKDHTLSKSEILSVVDDYYKASNSNNGIIWKGAYMENANIDAINFVEGRNEVPFEKLDVARSGASAVVIKVRVTGVTATSSSTADSSNPKTGDMIFAPIAVMTVSASALALFFFFNKKRAI